MPSFTVQSPALARFGPCCQVDITPSSQTKEVLKQQGKAAPSISVTALIDTGASGTAVSKKVVKGLILVARGVTTISTPSSDAHPTNMYDIDLYLPNKVGVRNVPVIEATLTAQNIDCLIGRDILRAGVLIYNGYTNSFTLSF